MQPHLLLLTRDPVLLAAITRAAAAAGVEPRHGSGALLDGWSTALVVVVGGDLVEEVAHLAPPRRARVLVVTASHLAADVHRHALLCGAEAVLDLVEVDIRLLDVLVDAVDGSGSSGALIAVVGGAGGVGASTFACALASTYAAAGGALLVDADPDGGGVDRVLGVESEDGVRRAVCHSGRQHRPRGDLGSWRPGASQVRPRPPLSASQLESLERCPERLIQVR